MGVNTPSTSWYASKRLTLYYPAPSLRMPVSHAFLSYSLSLSLSCPLALLLPSSLLPLPVRCFASPALLLSHNPSRPPAFIQSIRSIQSIIHYPTNAAHTQKKHAHTHVPSTWTGLDLDRIRPGPGLRPDQCASATVHLQRTGNDLI
ncbi:hypothetical protein LY78DRAFT_221886 [Colletotrichum sublineola]|nr:hypothetical protein LY78DRAFT_221886 [Colletotrichum sublineola]